MRVSSALLAAVFASQSASLVSAAQTAPENRPVPNSAVAQPRSKIVPDEIFFDGTIYTGLGMAEDKPQTVEAMAIGGGKVLAIGRSEAITRLAGPQTRLRDLKTGGGFVFPGFNDAHTHLGSAGETKLNVDLTGVDSLAAMLARIEVL